MGAPGGCCRGAGCRSAIVCAGRDGGLHGPGRERGCRSLRRGRNPRGADPVLAPSRADLCRLRQRVSLEPSLRNLHPLRCPGMWCWGLGVGRAAAGAATCGRRLPPCTCRNRLPTTPPRLQAGCRMPDNSTLASQECRLQASGNCTLAPTVVARGGSVNSQLVSGGQLSSLRSCSCMGSPSHMPLHFHAAAGLDPSGTRAAHAPPTCHPCRCPALPLAAPGFPVRGKPPPAMPGLVLTPAQGMDGGDFECAESVVPGACAFHDVLAAAFRCSSLLLGTCQSMVVYQNGTDGCQPQGLLAVLKVGAQPGAFSAMLPDRRAPPLCAGAHLSQAAEQRPRPSPCPRPPSRCPPTPTGRPRCSRL